jgi:FAD/FMN-containing dehydrogenase
MDDLPGEAVDAVAELSARAPSPLSLSLLQPLGGAIERLPIDSTAIGRRDAKWAYHALAQWDGPENDEANIAWAREIAQALEPYSTGGVYVTFSSDVGDARVEDAYRGHLDRLTAIKDRYDPGNMFHLGQNIRPSLEAAARAR